MNIFLIIITIISVIIAIIFACYKTKINNKIKEENKELENTKNSILSQISSLKDSEKYIQDSISKEKEHLSTIQFEIEQSNKAINNQIELSKKTIDNQIELSKKAFENYCEILEKDYDEKEEEYNRYKDALETSYSNLQLQLLKEYNECKEDLDKIKATRIAAIEAQRRERELEDNISLYCIPLSDADKSDIAKLETLKPSLNKPRVLSMLIWQTWFQKPLKTLSASILGVDDKTGIYKITNIKTKECYIGQAVSIKDRWAEHCKCGLGIDTPAANKLYKSMQDYGLWNFAFELLEECPKSDLNEKERYYIDLYNSCDLGFNSNRGVNK